MHNAQVRHSAPGRGLVGHTVIAFLCMTVGMSLCLSVVIRLGGR